MKFKKVVSFLVAIVAIIVIAQVCMFNNVAYVENRNVSGDIEVNTGGLNNETVIKEDTINDPDGLELTRALNRSNGKYVNFYIENLGENPVVATINGQKERTFEPGEKGHINFEVTQGIFGGDKNYTFKAVAGKDGGTVHIHYIIYQRDVQS